MSEKSGNDNDSGCLTEIVVLILLFVFCFGVTVDGKHYGVSCSCSDGVTVQHGAKP